MRFLVFVLFIYVLVQCKPKTPATETSIAQADTTRFFQVKEFIQKQIDDVNRTPFAIYHLHAVNDKHDSTMINNAVFNQLAQSFLQPDINDPSLKKYYTERIFFDETTRNFSLSYTTKNNDLIIQNLDVLLEEDGETVKRILIKKFINYTDSSAVEQLSWKPNERFQIIRLLQKGNVETSQQNTVVWNSKEERPI